MTGSLFACCCSFGGWGGHVRILWVGGNSVVIKLKEFFKLASGMDQLCNLGEN